MVVMNIKLNNFLLFDEFELCMAYPKKPVHTTIENEFLEGRPNFRYKKLVILMGANATGKTALGRILMAIFNFITNQEYKMITKLIENKSKEAGFELDIAFKNHMLYRITTKIKAKEPGSSDYNSSDISVEVRSESILLNDNYERCVARLMKKSIVADDSYITELEKVPRLSWNFEFTLDYDGAQRAIEPEDPVLYASVLQETLKILDPRIVQVDKIPQTENTYLILYKNDSVLIDNGKCVDRIKLSSGTVEGINLAEMITSMKLRSMDFYYCDEKFSHINSDVEKAFLSLFVDLLGSNQQLFFTSHNSDILEMDFPNHTYAFLRRDETDENHISCVYASDYIKKNNISLKNAVDNDMFSSVPDVSRIFELKEIKTERAVNE